MYRPCVLDGDANPYVVSPIKVFPVLRRDVWSFREHLKRMLGTIVHHAENFLDVFKGDILMEKVTHRIHKNNLRCLPRFWFVEHLGLKGEFKPISILRLSHGLEAFGHAFGITVFAAGTDLCAAGHRIPCRLSPLYCSTLGHVLYLLRGLY